MEVQVTILYSQLCVFDPALEAPFNDWEEAHSAQGFAWRPRSVAFATSDYPSAVAIDVTCADTPPDLGAASTAIRVPFEAPSSGSVEVGSVMSGVEVPIPPGSYALYYLAPPADGQPFRLIFVKAEVVEPEVLKEGLYARRQGAYLMTAQPA